MNHTQIVQDMNDTVDFCKRCNVNNEYSVYRPLPAVLHYRNLSLHQLMHYTNSTPLY